MTLFLLACGVGAVLWLLGRYAPDEPMTLDAWSARREAEIVALACGAPIEHPEEYAIPSEPWALTTREIERIEAEAFWRRVDAKRTPSLALTFQKRRA